MDGGEVGNGRRISLEVQGVIFVSDVSQCLFVDVSVTVLNVIAAVVLVTPLLVKICWSLLFR